MVQFERTYISGLMPSRDSTAYIDIGKRVTAPTRSFIEQILSQGRNLGRGGRERRPFQGHVGSLSEKWC